MKKVYPDAKAALDGLLFDGMLIAAGRLRPVRHPRTADRRDPRRGRQGPDRRLEQRGRRWLRPRPAAGNPAGEEDDLVLCGRECRIHAPVPVGRAGAGVQPAGHAGRADARGRRGHPRLLHRDRRRHGDRRGQGAPRFRRPGPTSWNAGSSPTCAIVKAWKADPSGNLVFRKTARNFNVPAATCGKVCVVEVEEIVPLGSLDPDTIHLPGIYVHRIVQGAHEKRIEQRTVRKREAV